MGRTRTVIGSGIEHTVAAAGPRLRRLGAGQWLDVAIVVVTLILFTIAWPTLQLTHNVPAGLQPVIAGLAALPFVLIRANPALGWAISAAGALVIPMAFERLPDYDFPWQVVHVMVIMALLLAVSMRSPIPVVAVAWLSTVMLFGANAPGNDGIGWAVGLSALVVFGLLVRWLVLSRRQLARQEEANEVERARRAVLEERARIARDLHDVVAHHMSLVVVQAQSAPYRLTDLSDEARAEFDSIGSTAREALNEIRGMLGVLRSDGYLPEDAPLPGLAGVDDLVDASRRAGMTIVVDRGPLPVIGETGELALYRILQESLANAARHAPGASVQVTLGGTDAAELSVVNGARTHVEDSAVPRGGGHGIVGMRERALSVGGSLAAHPRPGGGFEVHARIPALSPATP